MPSPSSYFRLFSPAAESRVTIRSIYVIAQYWSWPAHGVSSVQSMNGSIWSDEGSHALLFSLRVESVQLSIQDTQFTGVEKYWKWNISS